MTMGERATVPQTDPVTQTTNKNVQQTTTNIKKVADNYLKKKKKKTFSFRQNREILFFWREKKINLFIEEEENWSGIEAWSFGNLLE